MAAVPEIALAFVSPGGNGLKLLFRLDEPLSDAARFATVYKLFATQFARTHELTAVVDFATHDVTRACFMSYDPDARFRPDAPPLVVQSLLGSATAAPDELPLPELRAAERTIRDAPTPSTRTTGPDEATLRRIRERLHPQQKRRPKPTKLNVVVPTEVDQAVEYFGEQLREYELTLERSTPISYGRQLRIKATNGAWCELNIFYGKRGFSLVKTTKSGSHAELATLTAGVLEELLYARFEA